MLRTIRRYVRLLLSAPALFDAARQYVGLSDWLDQYAGARGSMSADASVGFHEEVASCAEAREEARQQLHRLLERVAA